LDRTNLAHDAVREQGQIPEVVPLLDEYGVAPVGVVCSSLDLPCSSVLVDCRRDGRSPLQR